MAAVDDGSSLSTPMEDRKDSGDGDASAQVAWMREYRARLEAKAAAEREAIEQRKADAEEKLEDFYHQRTNRLAQAAAAKRLEEEQVQQSQAEELDQATKNPWRRVATLVELQQGADDAPATDKARFRQVIVQLKASPLVRPARDAASTQ